MTAVDGTFWRVCGLGVLCAVSAFFLHRQSAQMATLVRIGGGILLVGALIVWFSGMPSELTALLESASLWEYASLMLKAVGVAVLCAVCADVCRECGAPQIATGVETAGNLAILGLCLPLLQELIADAEALLSLGGGS